MALVPELEGLDTRNEKIDFGPGSLFSSDVNVTCLVVSWVICTQTSASSSVDI